MEAELLEPESSTGPKKSRFNRAEPPLAGRPGQRSEVRERKTEREGHAAESLHVGLQADLREGSKFSHSRTRTPNQVGDPTA